MLANQGKVLKKMLLYILYLLFVPWVVYLMSGGEVNWNLLEVWYKVQDVMEYNMERGGWKRIGIILTTIMPVIIAVLIGIYHDLVKDNIRLRSRVDYLQKLVGKEKGEV